MRSVSTRWSLGAAGLLSVFALAACNTEKPPMTTVAPPVAPIVQVAPPVSPPTMTVRRRWVKRKMVMRKKRMMRRR